jgi:hypothetical protein
VNLLEHTGEENISRCQLMGKYEKENNKGKHLKMKGKGNISWEN